MIIECIHIYTSVEMKSQACSDDSEDSGDEFDITDAEIDSILANAEKDQVQNAGKTIGSCYL